MNTLHRTLMILSLASATAGAAITLAPPPTSTTSVTPTAGITTTRFGVVDMEAVYKNFYKVKQSEAEFENLVKNAQREMQNLMKSGDEMVKKFKDLQGKMQNPALSDTAKKALMSEIEKLAENLHKKQMEVAQFKDGTDQRLHQLEQTIVNNNFKEIQPKCDLVAKKYNLDFLFNSSGPNIVYVKDSFDYTKEIISVVNASAPQKEKVAPTAAAKTAK